jgi:hypothetical protein
LTKGNRAAELGYFDNYLIDNESCVIVGVQATAARLSQESAAARDMIDRCRFGELSSRHCAAPYNDLREAKLVEGNVRPPKRASERAVERVLEAYDQMAYVGVIHEETHLLPDTPKKRSVP